MIMPPRNWLAAVFGMENATAIEAADKTLRADFPGHFAHAKLAKDRRSTVHRELEHLERGAALTRDADLAASRAAGEELLSKPYSREMLARKVRQVMSKR
jgi:hypothetical protein